MKLRFKEKKGLLIKIIVTVSIMVLLAIIFLMYFVFKVFGTISNVVTIELGTKNIPINKFVMYGFDENKASFVTDLKELNLTKVCEHKVKIKYDGKIETSILRIVDTTYPDVVVKSTTKYLNYVPSPEDFIISINDLSETKSKIVNTIDTSKFGNYNVILEISDIYGNKVMKTVNLEINWIATEVMHELGTEFNVSEVVMNTEDRDKINAEDIEKVNPNKVGEYIVRGTYEEKEYTSIVSVKDHTPPVIELKDIEVYLGKTVNLEDFVVSIEDKSSYELSSNKKIDFTALGTQEIKIIVTDLYGNYSKQNVSVLIKEDTEGPIFSGLEVINTYKDANINYEEGVEALDDNDGLCKFEVNSTTVKSTASGTYYATYKSKDEKGNETIAKRKVVINDLNADVGAKFDTFYNNNLKGKNALQMTRIVRDTIWYNHSNGGNNPILYALNNKAGDCKVHAYFMQAVFNKAGMENVIIHTIDKTHYWNLVKIDGVWRHYDSTPGKHLIGPCTDSEKANSSGLHDRKWDASLYPKAN